MLTLHHIQSHKEQIVKRLRVRNFDASGIIDQIIETDNRRKNLQTSADQLQNELNEKSKEVGQLFKSGKQEEANQIKQELGALKDRIKKLNLDQSGVIEHLNALLVQVPNIPHESVPPGTGEQDNVKVREGGRIPVLDDRVLPHWELITKYDIIDFDLGIKITGAGFPLYKNKGARLQRALINFFLDENTSAGYREYLPPLVVNEDSAFGTGQLPDKEGQMYSVPVDNYYLIPTSEVPVTNIFRDIILDETLLPVKCTSYTPCFRREAGSWGKDVRGLNRLHQFDKVEIVQVTHPDKSYDTLEEMASHIEGLVVKLELPYRIMRLCGGDLGFTSALTYDFEVYAAAQQKWLEISSVSNFESFQTNRLKLRFKEAGSGKNRLAHTLNGSALALPRVVAALLENNQIPEGILIPEVLRPYTGFDLID
jgi:seryl-tRNA synthetase